MSGVTKIQFRCGTIMDAVLSKIEREIQIAHCPTPCELCKKQHGQELFEILEENVRL